MMFMGAAFLYNSRIVSLRGKAAFSKNYRLCIIGMIDLVFYGTFNKIEKFFW